MYEICAVTQKTRFETKSAAAEVMFDFRSRWQKLWNGRRRKHRQGRPSQKRVYYCPDCNGYHITSWKHYDETKYKNLSSA